MSNVGNTGPLNGNGALPHVPGWNPSAAGINIPDRTIDGNTLGVDLAVPPFNERFQVRLGSTLTPTKVTAALRQADLGYMWLLADLLDEVRETDPHMHSVLFKREHQVAGADIEIHPPDYIADRRQRRAAQQKGSTEGSDECVAFIKAEIERMESFTNVVAHLQGGNYYGRSVLENIWGRDGKYLALLKAVPLHWRRFAYATDWRLHLWDQVSPSPTPQFGAYPGVALDRFPRGKFITHTPRIFGGYPTREGLGRLLVWFACFKRWTVRDWMAYAEIVGRPLRKGIYQKGQDDKPVASDIDVAVLKAAVDQISGATGVTLPDTVKLEIEQAMRSNNVHETLNAFLNGEMSKAVLGETLTTEAGVRGARSLGEVHDEIRLMIAKSDARACAQTLRRDLFTPMIRFRFGAKAPVPVLVFGVDPRADLDGAATRLEKGVKAGVKISQADAREMLQWPDPQEGDELVELPAGGGGGAKGTPSFGDLEEQAA